MSRAGGFILRLSAKRLRVFKDSLFVEGYFAEPVAEFSHSRSAPLICFIMDDDRHITHMGSGRRGIRAGTELRRLNVSKIQTLSEPISADRILSKISARTRHHVRNRFKDGGLVPPKSFEHLVDTILELAPETRDLIAMYSRIRRDRLARLSDKARASLAAQKETVTTALAIAGIEREPLQRWTPTDDATPVSFLDGLPTARLREDPMVVNDLAKLPGYDLVKTYPYTAAVFQGKTARLTIVLANRQPLEEQLGTDLIYYNETYKSFVMVQYKAMESDKHGAVFRIPNQQLTKEIKRMDRVLAELRKCLSSADRDGFRLNENPFFLKFCPRTVFNPDDTGLVPGMYLPLDYWKRSETDQGLVGPRGGRRLTYQTVGRYFNNTSFVTLVANAWVGTTHTQSAVLKEVIRTIIESGKAVAVAVKTDDPDPDDMRVEEFSPFEGSSFVSDLED